jgi:hypothetical protein
MPCWATACLLACLLAGWALLGGCPALPCPALPCPALCWMHVLVYQNQLLDVAHWVQLHPVQWRIAVRATQHSYFRLTQLLLASSPQLAPQHTQGAAGPDTMPRDQADPLAELAGGGDGCALHVASTAPHAALHHAPAAMLDSPVADPYHLTDLEPALDAVQHADRE